MWIVEEKIAGEWTQVSGPFDTRTEAYTVLAALALADSSKQLRVRQI
jgi:hypothetical protein